MRKLWRNVHIGHTTIGIGRIFADAQSWHYRRNEAVTAFRPVGRWGVVVVTIR